jgi:HK97 family phage prohead protease
MRTTTTLKQLVTTVSAIPARGHDAGMLISTPGLDRDNDRVMPEGVDLTNFRRSAPLLWAHNYREIPIGTVTSVDVRSDGLRAYWRWLEGDEFADRVKNAWDQGVVRAASIGFRPRHSVPNEEGGMDIKTWELLEVSLCPVGANPEAVRTLKALGLAEDGEPYLLLDDERMSWTPRSIAQAAAAAVERHWADRREPVLYVEDDGEELVRVDLELVNRLAGDTVARGVAALVGRAVTAELNYHRGRIE